VCRWCIRKPAGANYGLLANHAVPSHLSHAPAPIGDIATSGARQLDREFALFSIVQRDRTTESDSLPLGLVVEELVPPDPMFA